MESTIIKRTVLSGVDPDERIHNIKHYQVYRGVSPTTANRYEIRIRELEDALEAEREMRLRAERGFTEISFEAGSLSDKLDEADGMTAAQLEAMRRRDQEIMKLKKELELLQMQASMNEAGLKKRHQDAISLLLAQLEAANKHKSKGDSEKQQLNIQIDLLSSEADAAGKARYHAESQLDNLHDQLRRLKAQNEELNRANADLSSQKNKQAQELLELQKQLHDLDLSYQQLLKLKNQLQAQLDEARAKLEDEVRLRLHLASQLHALQSDFDHLSARYEEEAANAANLKAQLTKALADLQLLKNKYDSDLLHRTTELEDLRRKTGGRILELEELFEQARGRAAALDKEKIRLHIEIRDYSSQLENANAFNLDLGKRLKGYEGSAHDLQKRVDELTLELTTIGNDHQKDQAELARLRALVAELTDKSEHLARENKHLTDNLRDALASNNDLSRQVQELSHARSQLLAERDALLVEVADLKEALRDALAKLELATQTLAHVKADLERKLKEKEDELERLRKAGQKAIDDMQRALMDNEAKFNAEISRLKKKYEQDVRELEMQLDALSRANAELSKQNKALTLRVKELELLLEEERRALEEARLAATSWERRFVALHAEYENLQAQFDMAEKARKGFEARMGDSDGKVKELTITINTLSGEKRRFESECHSLRTEFDALLAGKRAADEKVDRLQSEVTRLMELLRTEQDARGKADAGRKALEAEVKELRLRLEELEAIGGRDAKTIISRMEMRLRELEHELEAERRRSKDLMAESKKYQRMYQEIKVLSDERQRKIQDLSSLVEQLSAKNIQLKRQIEEVEEVVGITIGKYRKGQSQVVDAQRRADNVERHAAYSRMSPIQLPIVARGVGMSLSSRHHHHHHPHHLPIRASSVAPLSSAYHPLGSRSLSVSREVKRVARY